MLYYTHNVTLKEINEIRSIEKNRNFFDVKPEDIYVGLVLHLKNN